MEEFVRRKRTVVEAGSLKEEDFAKLDELGCGNGGIVYKVRHRATGIVMARKVRPHHRWPCGACPKLNGLGAFDFTYCLYQLLAVQCLQVGQL